MYVRGEVWMPTGCVHDGWDTGNHLCQRGGPVRMSSLLHGLVLSNDMTTMFSRRKAHRGRRLGCDVDEGSGDGMWLGVNKTLRNAAWAVTWMHGDGTVDCRGSPGGRRAWGETDGDGIHVYMLGHACLAHC